MGAVLERIGTTLQSLHLQLAPTQLNDTELKKIAQQQLEKAMHDGDIQRAKNGAHPPSLAQQSTTGGQRVAPTRVFFSPGPGAVHLGCHARILYPPQHPYLGRERPQEPGYRTVTRVLTRSVWAKVNNTAA